jgi:hypothetical protein
MSAKDKTYPIARPLFYMFDKKNAAKVKQLLIMHFLLKGKNCWRSGVYSVGLIYIIKKGYSLEATFLYL